jgi:hypothetical protein
LKRCQNCKKSQILEDPDVLKNIFGAAEHGWEVLSAIADDTWDGIN